MKSFAIAILLLSHLGGALAQGTMYYEAHLTGNDPLISGEATFSLTTNLFTYGVTSEWGFELAQIRSPWPDTNAPTLFNLQQTFCVPPQPFPGTNAGYCLFRGTLTLTDPQISDLMAGRWYVYSSQLSGAYFLSGQIVSVPEPHGAALLAFGSLLLRALNGQQKTFRLGTNQPSST